MNRVGTAITGAIGGLVTGLAVVVILGALVTFSAIARETTSGIRSVVETRYTAGADGGFDLSFGPGPGALVLVLAATVLGAVLAIRRARRRESDPDADR